MDFRDLVHRVLETWVQRAFACVAGLAFVSGLTSLPVYAYYPTESFTVPSDESSGCIYVRDSLNVSVKLSAKLDEYLAAMGNAPIDVKIEETDTLISACKDSLMRVTVAEIVFEHYRLSKLMGDEAVAVHVADRWGLGGDAAVFADFNRLSLLGMPAPPLEPVLPSFERGKKTVLYFYDTSCRHCVSETAELVSVLGRYQGEDVDFVAFYTGADSVAWRAYIADSFPQDFPVRHYMDAGNSSDFRKKYGVDGTPRLFLVSEDGLIEGRRLDAAALRQLLGEDEVQSGQQAYGNSSGAAFFDRLFRSYGKSLTTDDINFVSDYLADSVSEAANDARRRDFKQMLRDLLYYLASEADETYLEACDHLITCHILSDNGIWTTPEDSLNVVSYAEILDDLLSRARVGNKIPSVRLDGTLYRLNKSYKPYWKNGRRRRIRIDRIGGEKSIIVFHSPGCGDCDEQIAAVKAVTEAAAAEKITYDLRFFVVNLTEIESDNPDMFRKAADSLDLSRIPYLVETDAKGVVRRRYFRL